MQVIYKALIYVVCMLYKSISLRHYRIEPWGTLKTEAAVTRSFIFSTFVGILLSFSSPYGLQKKMLDELWRDHCCTDLTYFEMSSTTGEWIGGEHWRYQVLWCEAFRILITWVSYNWRLMKLQYYVTFRP